MSARRPLAFGLLLALLGPSAVARADDDDGRRRPTAQFGPWDAGEKRDVKRQGKAGFARTKHPVVGEVAKVPGDGPPPPPLRSDPDVPETAIATANDVAGGMSSNPMYLAALVYGRLLTRVDGPRCQHYPTCSRFANQAVARHGVIGIFIGLDRLIQPPQSSALRSLPQIEGFGGVRHLDPLENYEFWKPGRFTGFPPAVDEEPPELPGPRTGAGDGEEDAVTSSLPAGDAASGDAS